MSDVKVISVLSTRAQNSKMNIANLIFDPNPNPNPNEILNPETDPDQVAISSISCNLATTLGLIDERPLLNVDAHVTSPAPVTSQIQTAAQHRDNAKAQKRVPFLKRQRTNFSCDTCKAKGCKCLRTVAEHESIDGLKDNCLVPCKTCVNAGIECETTLPRRQRMYEGLEQLDQRYRALDALAIGLFTNLSADATADEVVEYGRQRGLNMPDLGPGLEA